VRQLKKQEISAEDIRHELEERLDRDALLILCQEVGLDSKVLEDMSKPELISIFLEKGSLEGLLANLMGPEASGEERGEMPADVAPKDDEEAKEAGEDIEVSKQDLRKELIGFWDQPTLEAIAAGSDVSFDEGADKVAVIDAILDALPVQTILSSLMQREAKEHQPPADAPVPSSEEQEQPAAVEEEKEQPAAVEEEKEQPAADAVDDDLEVLRQMRALRSAMTPPEQDGAVADAAKGAGDDHMAVTAKEIIGITLAAALLVFVVLPRLRPLGVTFGLVAGPSPAATQVVVVTPQASLIATSVPTPASSPSVIPMPTENATVHVTQVATPVVTVEVTPSAIVVVTATVEPTQEATELATPIGVDTPDEIPLTLPGEEEFSLPSIDELITRPAEIYPRLALLVIHPDEENDLAAIAEALGDDSEEAEAVATVLQDSPAPPGSLANEGLRHLLLGEFTQAETAFRKVVWKSKPGPARTEIFLLLAKARWAQKKLNLALNTYLLALKEDGSSELAALGVYRMYAARGNTASGEQVLRAYLAKHDSAQFTEILGVEPSPAAVTLEPTPTPTVPPTPPPIASVVSTPTVLVEVATKPPTALALPALVAGLNATPTPQATAVTVSDPTSPVSSETVEVLSPVDVSKNELLLKKANELEKSGRAQAAIEIYEEIIDRDGALEAEQLRKLQLRVGDHYREIGEPQRALVFYVQADSLETVSPVRALALARIAREAKDEAVRKLYLAKAKPVVGLSDEELLQTAAQLEREYAYQEAAALYLEITERSTAPAEIRGEAHFNLAFCCRISKQFELATKHAQTAESLGHPVPPGFWVLLNMRR